MKPKWTAQQIEIAIANHFNYRQNLIVPNVSWGLFKHHEADLIILSKANWCTEVEIKVSAADIKKDLSKRHNHREHNIKSLWFAVPEELKDNPLIPSHAGILYVSRYLWRSKTRYSVRTQRLPTPDKKAVKFTEEERNKLLRLGCLRVWGLKEKLNERRNFITEKIIGWQEPKKIDIPFSLLNKPNKNIEIVTLGKSDYKNQVIRNCVVKLAIVEKGVCYE